jgi:hypothetical protein
MIIRYFYGVKAMPARKADDLTAIYDCRLPIV